MKFILVFLYKIIKKTIETYELPQNRLFTRVSTVLLHIWYDFWIYFYWTFFLVLTHGRILFEGYQGSLHISQQRAQEAELARRAGRPRYFQLSTVGRRRTPVKMGTNSPVFQSVTAY